MAKHSLPLLLAMPAIVLTAAVAAQAPSPAAGQASDNNSTTTTPTAYEMLKKYDFPPGILPEGAESYKINQDSSFEANFPDECHFRVAKQYDVRYSSRVAGNIQNGSISGLEGVKVKVVFAWVGIGEVGRDGDELKLKAGPISQSFPVDDSRQCN